MNSLCETFLRKVFLVDLMVLFFGVGAKFFCNIDEGEEDEKLVASTSAQAVSVSRLKKKKAKASKRLKRRDENEGLVAEENGLVINAGEKDVKAVENVDNDVDANLERILSVIGVVESLPMTPSTDDVMLEGDVSGYISSAAIPLVSIESASLEQEEEPVSCKILHGKCIFKHLKSFFDAFSSFLEYLFLVKLFIF